jgi:hypothetical protein
MASERMTLYRRYKVSAEYEAIEWQLDFNNHNYSYSELAAWQEYFERRARRYGLVKVFQENGII